MDPVFEQAKVSPFINDAGAWDRLKLETRLSIDVFLKSL